MTHNKDQKTKDYKNYIERISNETIPCYEPDVGSEELELVKDVIDSNWLSEGKYVREFEKRLSIASQMKYALAFNNCTAALITGMKSLGIGVGDEVIVQSLVHSADPNAISATGATPIFADVDKHTLCLGIDSIKKVVTKKTKAILHVALYGNTSNLDDLTKYCEDNNFLLINDCAPAIFGYFKGRSIASYGHFSALSFFADKTITTGEGGMLLTNDAALIGESNIYKHDGRKERGVDVIERKGFNYRLTELQAAVGVAQLKKSDYFIQKKKENNLLYKSLLKNENVTVFDFNDRNENIPHRNVIFVPNAKLLVDYLVSKGVGARTLFMPMHSQPVYDTGETFPVTEKLYETGVCLPSAPSLTVLQIEYICELINEYIE
jgi:perosamine synthetase